jgi:predicted O-linked N-acetylglucosamine transferase (SPINDLY family)
MPPLRATGPDRRLTLGFVSSDLRTHSISWFLLPLLANLDRKAFRVACYDTGVKADRVTERLRRLSDVWRNLPRLTPSALSAQIRADGVDIAIDLSGHTAGHRLATLHMRPAPLQVTWLGYPNTTGVRAIDLRIVDAVTDPLMDDGASSERPSTVATERLLRLPECFLCYGPPDDALEPTMPEPGGSSGGVVFGSFSTLSKVNDACAALWAKVLGAVPGSRLLLKNRAFATPAVRDRVVRRLAAAGLDPARIEAAAWTDSTADHLAYYRRLHIALDTWPYCGTTTTCEALWMGVPVVTLAGATHASRVGASLLTTTELTDLIARTEEEYVSIAAALAADPARIAALRSSLRERMRRSPLCDAPGFAARFGAALRAEWIKACDISA